MSSSLIIKYKDPGREEYYYPFSFQWVLREYWWPIAEKLNLNYLRTIEFIDLSERKNLEEFIEEILAVENYLKENDFGDEGTRENIFETVGQMVPKLKEALVEWEEIEEIYFC